MGLNKVFPDHSLKWYLSRGTLVAAGVGATLGFLLVVFLTGMGDAPIADDVRSVVPYVVGWAIMGFLLGLVWWLVAKALWGPSA